MELSLGAFERGGLLRSPAGGLPGGLPGGLAVLLASAAGRQASSPTARAQAWLAQGALRGALLVPAHGAFHPATARLLHERQQG